METERLYCCGCKEHVKAELTDGSEIYPHRFDLTHLFFWICRECGCYVGCHKSHHGKTPLGCLPTAKIRELRKEIHAVLDPLWQSGKVKRKSIYSYLGRRMGSPYHTAEIRTVREAKRVLAFIIDYDKNKRSVAKK